MMTCCFKLFIVRQQHATVPCLLLWFLRKSHFSFFITCPKALHGSNLHGFPHSVHIGDVVVNASFPYQPTGMVTESAAVRFPTL